MHKIIFIVMLLGSAHFSWAKDISATNLINHDDIERLTVKIEQLYYADNKALSYAEVKYISENVLPHQQYYPDVAIAKLYLILANLSSSKSDVDTALSYIKLALNTNIQDQKVRRALLLKLASLHMAKKQFQKLLTVSEELLRYSHKSEHENYNLLSLSYRSVAFVMLGYYERALTDLIKLEQIIDQKVVSSEYIELFTILATAYHYLGDYQTALTIQLKVLKLRFDLNKKQNIDQTYLLIGYAYLYLQRFDDAYNAFWEAKKYAQIKQKTIGIAFANKGIGLSFFKLKQFHDADKILTEAGIIFKQYNLTSDYIETLVALASVKLSLHETDIAYDLLNNTVSLLGDNELSLEYAGFYRMLAEMYFEKGSYKQAYLFSQKHSQFLLFKVESKKKEAKYTHYFYNQTLAQVKDKSLLNKTKELTIKLAGNSELATSFQDKYYKQHTIIIVLFVLLSIFLACFFVYLLKVRANKSKVTYEQLDSNRIMTNPLQTKQHYQYIYQKSRKYQYPLSVCYITIENWQELVFSFNKKRVNEVTSIVIGIIQEQLVEFEFVGALNEGEYLLLFEHQHESEVSIHVEKLVEALNALFFGNLGNFSVMIKYQLSSPSFKYIDPFSFLAKLTDSDKIATEKQTKEL